MNYKIWVQFSQIPLESNLICEPFLLQISQESALPADPSKDVNFKEDRVDKLRAQKDDELDRYRRMAERAAATRDFDQSMK